MKEEIARWKEQNGNVNYTVKELLYGVNAKLDKIEESLNTNNKTIAVNKTKINGLVKILSVCIPSFCAALGWIIFRGG